MPQYFFRVENGEPIAGDSEEFPDDGAARAAAEDIARELSKNRIDGEQWRIVVTNEAGEHIVLFPPRWVKKKSSPPLSWTGAESFAYAFNISSACLCTRLSPATTTRPPACAGPPSQVVTM